MPPATLDPPSHRRPPALRRPGAARLAAVTAGIVLALLAVGVPVRGDDGPGAKRVLVVHSFGAGAPPFTVHSTTFTTTLVNELQERADIDEVSLGMARYAQPDMEEAFVEFLLKRLTRWHPDLVAPIGSPAARFVAKYRHRLFPQTPIIYTGLDRRTLSDDTFDGNATFIGESFNLAGLVEDILQVAPDTDHIVVVIGASPLEGFWRAEFARAFAPFTDRVRFTWVHQLSLQQMLELVSTLPPRSFVLVGLLVRDALGVTHNQDDVLQRLHAVSTAPINGLFRNQLGLGIVGGRLYQAEAQGAESARIAARILRGEPISSFPPLIIPPERPRYDWRELQRWNISEARLPPGSVVEFRAPTTWQRFRGWIIGGLGVMGLQGSLIVLLVRNLVRRRRAEQSLRESEARVNLAAESAEAGLWSLDRGTGSIWATSRLRELFGFRSEEVLTEARLVQAIHPEDRARVRQFFDESRPGLNVECRVVLPDGRTRWIVTRGQLDQDRAVGDRRWRGVSVDITERKETEEQLRESASRFRIIADSVPVLIWMSDATGASTFRNKPWLDFTGRTAEQESGDGWAESVHPEDRPDCLKLQSEAFHARRPFFTQYRLRRRDGEYRWMSDTGVPRDDAQGGFTGYIGSCTDITERLRAEDRVRQVFEAAPNATIMIDGDRRIVVVNQQVERVFGYQREELVGAPIDTLIPGRLHARAADRPAVRTLGAGGDLFGRRKDGSEVPVEVSLNVIHSADGLFVVASIIDISERQQAEAERQALRQELAHISRVVTMGELTAAIVHELGQPLTAILSNAQAGVRSIASGHFDVNELREILEDVVADDQRAGQVIRHLRSLFQKHPADYRPLVLNALVDDVVAVVSGDANLKRVAIVLDLAPELPAVFGDRIQLQQVLLNLIVNAFDAMANVTDRRRQVTVRTRALDGRVRLEVADTGPGIAPDRLASIFKPFVTTTPGGMGMGLSVSHSIVRAHDGKLWAENGPGGGAVFHVELLAMAGEPRG